MSSNYEISIEDLIKLAEKWGLNVSVSALVSANRPHVVLYQTAAEFDTIGRAYDWLMNEFEDK